MGNFAGNGWVGRCKNCPTQFDVSTTWGNSYCACNGGKSNCPCSAAPIAADPFSAVQGQATGKPTYPPNMAAYGWGCKAHDGESEGKFIEGWNTTTCETDDTADGEAADWCPDHWCIV